MESLSPNDNITENNFTRISPSAKSLLLIKETMESAKAFFESEGFVIDKEAEPDYSNLDSLNYLIASASPEQLGGLGKSPGYMLPGD